MSADEKAIIERIRKALSNGESYAIKVVAKKIHMAPSTTSKYLGKMEGRGIVEMDDSEPPRKKYRLKKGSNS